MHHSSFIDLRSDTVTRPSKKMREAILQAEFGDDVYREDFSVNKLEEEVALLFKKESAIYLASGTMANLIGVMVHCRNKGESVIMGSACHINNYEGGGISAIGNVMSSIITNKTDGTFDLQQLISIIPPPTEHIAQPKLICMENTVCNCSGAVIPIQHIQAVYQIAQQNQLKMHLDGARMANACISLNISLSEMAAYFHTITFCLSKGLGAPMGSMLIGSKEDIEYARNLRKMLGGGMRQVGVMAAMARVALAQDWTTFISDDHQNAQYIANLIQNIKGYEVINFQGIKSNIFRFRMTSVPKQKQDLDHKGLTALLKEFQIIINPTFENDAIRLVTHRDVNKEQLLYLSNVLDHIMNEVTIACYEKDVIFKDRNIKLNMDEYEVREVDKEKIDMRSDTVTLPTAKMRQLMGNAEVGDDVYSDDQLVNQLQDRFKTEFGKEDALFLPSGTMGNLIAAMIHCKHKGDAIIIGSHSHMRKYERANLASIGNIYPLTVSNHKDGTLDLQELKQVLEEFRNNDDVHLMKVRAVCLESSQNYCGGKVIQLDYITQLKAICDHYKVKLHLDGARVFNTTVFLNLDLVHYVQYFDTVQVCLSKGLGCPVGSILMSTKEGIFKARTLRKMLGGNMRQIGILAAAGLDAIQNYKQIIINDHENAKYLYSLLKSIPEITLEELQTNILFYSLSNCNPQQLQEYFNNNTKTKVNFIGNRLRIVIHQQITKQSIDLFIKQLSTALQQQQQ